MNATMKIPPAKLPYRGEPTREAHITDEELRMIEAGEKIVKPTGRVALKGNLTWKAEDDEKLIRLSEQGLSEKAISIEMRRSKGSIETRLHYLRKRKNLTCQRITKPWTAEEDELVASAYKSGKSVPEICEETGRTKDSVVHRLQKLSKTGAFEMRPRGEGKEGARKMSNAEILERFEDWLIDEIDSLSDLPECRESFHEAKYILRHFRKIRDDVGREEKE